MLKTNLNKCDLQWGDICFLIENNSLRSNNCNNGYLFWNIQHDMYESDVQMKTMTILRDWTVEAEPPAVNDLVKAVKSINMVMHQQLVDYLRGTFPEPSKSKFT
eukprot:GHVU01075068.1.p2 GENE.GHVU01075068.1~~GHVU01075068.1.p2  ORF type:complete len:104 (+),score=12.04 GHVU01075068.1:158-469(+)